MLKSPQGQTFIPFEEEEKFAVSFIHSVNNTEVEEGYYIDNKTIILDYCLYAGFGAGVATETPPGGSLEMLPDGRMLLKGFDMPINELAYIVGTVSDHILHINGEEISLRELCGKNSRVSFTVKHKIVFRQFS